MRRCKVCKPPAAKQAIGPHWPKPKPQAASYIPFEGDEGVAHLLEVFQGQRKGKPECWDAHAPANFRVSSHRINRAHHDKGPLPGGADS